jgi:hypothetical protein
LQRLSSNPVPTITSATSSQTDLRRHGNQTLQENQLLSEADEMSKDLCGFADTWEQKTIPIRQQYETDISKGINTEKASALYDARLDYQSQQMRIVYEQTYKENALRLRGELMERVHDTGEGSGADYNLDAHGVVSRLGGRDDNAYSRMDMQDVCRDFSNLLAKYKAAIQGQEHNGARLP